LKKFSEDHAQLADVEVMRAAHKFREGEACTENFLDDITKHD
jgi:hypothetical protein